MTTQLTLSVIDSLGNQQFLNEEQAVNLSTGQPLTIVNAAGATVPVLQPVVAVLPQTQSLTFTVVSIPANTITVLHAANPTRKSFQILNISTAFVTVSTNSAVTIGAGYPLEVASAAGHQGGSTPIYDGSGSTIDAWYGISASASTVLVIEGA